MVSNHIVMPVALKLLAAGNAVSGDVRSLVLTSRRISIGVVLGLGFLYFYASGGSDALAAIGLIAFVGVAQFLPSLLGGIYWRGATRVGALSGLLVGFALWAYTLFLPSFGGDFILSANMLSQGPWGADLLRPQALFGLQEMDPLVHAVVWSIGANALTFLIVSSLTQPHDLERLQGALFVDVDVDRSAGSAFSGFASGSADSEDLFVLAQRILGTDPAKRLFDEMAKAQGTVRGLPRATDAVIARLERELAGSIGAVSAHAMVTSIAGRQTVGITELIDIADETQELIETSRQLAQKSDELERAARQLRQANERLRALDTQKDAFLSQVSHELRTPMTSIRSFSEILVDDTELSGDEQERFVSIIHEESIRLTRLLDELLDINRLESGTAELDVEPINVNVAVTSALNTISGMTQSAGVEVSAVPAPEDLSVHANNDRLRQVLINVLSNAVKYNASDDPKIEVRAEGRNGAVHVDVIDNGGGVSREDAAMVFEKFARGSRSDRSQGAGLGLPISRAIMQAMRGDLTIEFAPDGTSFFRLSLPKLA
jgi:signal transduction histidine kinase